MISDLQSAQSGSVTAEASLAERCRQRQNLTSEDVDLMSRVAQRDVPAFEQLYHRFSPPLFSLALRITRSWSEAEEVLQEVFCAIWSNASRYHRPLGSPFTWAATITRRRAIDRLRTQVRRAKHLEAVPHPRMDTPADASNAMPLIATESGCEVRSALATISADEQHVIALAFFDGFTHAEIAIALEIPPGTVKARIRRGIFKLRAKFTALGYVR